jgi:tetratricopeptide (TPR) repeat protein
MFIVGFFVVGIVFLVSVYAAVRVLSGYGVHGYRYALPLAHTVVIVGFAFLWFAGGPSHDSMSMILWVIPTILDMPMALYYPMIALGSDVGLALAALILGGTEYALIGWLIDWVRSKNRQKLLPSKKTKIALTIFLLVGGAVLYQRITYSMLPDYKKTEVALERSHSPQKRYRLLWDAMIEHSEAHQYQQAERYAQEFLRIAPPFKSEQCNYYADLYVAHTILGKTALAEGNTTKALHHLHASVDINLTEQEKKYFTGVNLTLADQLYRKGYKKEVLAFMRKCVSLQYAGFDYYQTVHAYLLRLEKGEDPRFDLSIDFY